MINITLMTSNNDEIIEKILQYYQNDDLININSVISNSENNIEKKLRRYRKKIKIINQYKIMDSFLNEMKTNYIFLINYNEKIPPNFNKKYEHKLFRLINNENGIFCIYEKQKLTQQDILFQQLFKNDDKFEHEKMKNRLFPILIEKIIKKINNIL